MIPLVRLNSGLRWSRAGVARSRAKLRPDIPAQRYKPMKNRFVCRMVLLAFLALVCVFSISAAALPGFAQARAKKVVKTQADLPRFNYKLAGSATDLLQSTDVTFDAFAARVRADVGSVLANYDVQDHAALRELLGVHLDLQMLAGDIEGALETVQKLRAVEDKPDAK